MNEARFVKFETMIEDVNSKIKKDTGGSLLKINMHKIGASDCNVALALIFDYYSCNEFAKIIMDKSELIINPAENQYIDKWREQYPNITSLGGTKEKMNASKLLVQYCKEIKNMYEGYKFVFWSLMILAVDSRNAEDHLSLICDFAVMLGISEAEFEDMIHVVKKVCQGESGKYEYKTDMVKKIFGSLYSNGDESEPLFSEEDKKIYTPTLIHEIASMFRGQ